MASKKKQNFNSDYSLDELFPDVAERLRIEGLPEVEREELIYDRVTELQKQKDRELLMNEGNKDSKQKAIEDIKSKRRNKFSNYNQIGRKTYQESPESGELSSEEYQKTKGKLRLKNKKENNNDDLELSESFNNKILDELEVKNKEKEEDVIITENDLETIRISRFLFEKYNNHKLFNTTINNCFVRLNLGGKSNNPLVDGYMIAQIKKVMDIPEESYKIGDNEYCKYFMAQHGADEKKFSFTIVSNSAFGKFEFEKWISRMEKSKLELPLKSFMRKKAEEIEQMKNYVLSNEEIHKNFEEKRAEKIRKRDKGLNVTLELEEINERYQASIMKVNILQEDLGYVEKAIVSNSSNNKDNRETNNKLLKKHKEELIAEINKYNAQKNELTEFIEILTEMQFKKLKEKDELTYNEPAYKINLKNSLNQKQLDKENRLLNKKRSTDEQNAEVNPYKRRECAPLNRFSKNINESNFKVSSIKMTETKEDTYIGTPKELYNRREKELIENKKLFQGFFEKINCNSFSDEGGNREKDCNIFKCIADCNTNLTTTKKGFYGLFKTAEINFRDFVESENERLLLKYKVSSSKDVPEFQFI